MRCYGARRRNDGVADGAHCRWPERRGEDHTRGAYAEQKNQSYLAADRIAEEIDPDDPYAVRMAAGRQFLRRLDAFIDDRISFVVESTLAGRGLAQAVDRMNGAGYVTRIAFVFLDSADRCVRRVQERIRVMLCRKKTFVARYTRSKTNFWT